MKLEPKSALAEKALAQILKHDLVGREPAPGQRSEGRGGSVSRGGDARSRRQLIRGDLAILLEYDAVGRRYGRQARLKDADR